MTDHAIVAGTAILTGTAVTWWLIRAAFTRAEVDTRPKCAVRTSVGECGRVGVANVNDPISGQIWKCSKHLGWEW